jgi:hypothetical protein
MEKAVCGCEIKLTETEDGYSLEVKGKEVKKRLKGCLEQAKRLIEMCCAGKKPFVNPTNCCK